jgi:hypothetical protein
VSPEQGDSEPDAFGIILTPDADSIQDGVQVATAADGTIDIVCRLPGLLNLARIYSFAAIGTAFSDVFVILPQ